MTQRTLCSISKDKERAIDMCNYILSLLTDKPKINGHLIQLTERTRQFMTWGATDLQPIANTDGEVGLEMSVSGLIHKGKVRVWYTFSDLFDVELINKDGEVVNEQKDLYCDELHDRMHCAIERTDDPPCCC